MTQKIHQTFAWVCSIQTYSVDDLLEAEIRRRDSMLKSLVSQTEYVQRTIESGTKMNYVYFSEGEKLRECHNTILALEEMKDRGITELKLNTGKNMHHQILAQSANSEFLPNFYKHKLEKN